MNMVLEEVGGRKRMVIDVLRSRIWLIVCFLLISSSCTIGPHSDIIKIEREIIFNDGRRVDIEEGLLFVPENRAADNARQLPLYFVRVPALSASGRSPVLYIPGGPGSALTPYDCGSALYTGYPGLETDWARSVIDLVGGNRDLIFINHRGAPRLPFSPNLIAYRHDTDGTRPQSHERRLQAYRDAIKSAQEAYEAKGADLAGYDIIHVRDDLEALRQALGYDQITLFGGSFGSQLSLAYLQAYSEYVDRAVLFGVEPLSHAYDSPAALDATIQRVFKDAAEAGIDTANEQAGYSNDLQLLHEIKRRLNDSPVEVSLPGRVTSTIIDGNDFADVVAIKSLGQGELLQRVSYLPKFVHEVANGDYRYLGYQVQNLNRGAKERLIFPMIDNSLGISRERDRDLLEEAKKSFVGKINEKYRLTRTFSPTPNVDDDFRRFEPISVPVLLIHGTFDFSTPYENALELKPFLENGYVVSVNRGTHNIYHELSYIAGQEKRQLISDYLSASSSMLPVGELQLELPEVDYIPIDSPSLFDSLANEKAGR